MYYDNICYQDKMCKDTADEHEIKDGGSILKSKQWRLCLMLFLAYAIALLHRVNLSMAVVCMVRPHTDIAVEDGNLNSSTTSDSANMSLTEMTKSPMYPDNSLHEDIYIAHLFQEDSYIVDWDRSLVSVLLSSYFYGSIITQIPAGKMADTLGGKNLMLAVYIVTAIGALLTPICVKIHVSLVFVIRILIGLAAGAVFPVGIAMIGAWAPPKERATMIALSGCGVSIGPAISYLTSGYLCAYGFDGGWPSIFYIHGIVAALFVVLWWFQAYNSPSEHPSISRQELAYIKATRKHLHVVSDSKTPWRSIWLSRPMWASVWTHFAFNWGFYTILINVPIFMKELLHFDITQNAFYSALPYLFFFGATILWAKMTATILDKRYLDVLTVRKLLTSIGLVGPSACLIAVGHMTVEYRFYSVVLLCAACMFTAMNLAGFLANHGEYAGMYSGTAYGISNAISVIAAILAALVAGIMTPNGSRTEWQNVFYLSAGVNTSGVLVFCLLASATLQTWARPQPQTITMYDNGEKTDMFQSGTKS